MNIFDFSSAKADEGAVLQLLHPDTFEPLEGQTITLMGSDSEKAIKLKRQREQAAIKRASRGRNAPMPTPEELYKQATEDLVELTVTWTLSGPDGPIPATREKFAEIYSDRRISFIRNQALEFIATTGNFLTK
jgi:hypothetical protein